MCKKVVDQLDTDNYRKVCVVRGIDFNDMDDIWIMDVNGNNRTKLFDNAIMPEWN